MEYISFVYNVQKKLQIRAILSWVILHKVFKHDFMLELDSIHILFQKSLIFMRLSL